MMPRTSSSIGDAPCTRGMVVLIGIAGITILFLVSAGNVLSHYNDATHTIVWNSVALNNSSNSNLLRSLTSDNIAPDLQQTEPESKSLRINDLNPTQVSTQVVDLVSVETEAEAIQTDSTMLIHKAFLKYGQDLQANKEEVAFSVRSLFQLFYHSSQVLVPIIHSTAPVRSCLGYCTSEKA